MVKIHMAPTRSQAGVSRPFNESDMRRNPELIGQAIAYAINYSGTFEFMQQCQARALREGTLPLNLCRAVLNCMRQDPDVIIDYDDEDHLAPVTPLHPYPEPAPTEEDHATHPSAQARQLLDEYEGGRKSPSPPTEEEVDAAMAKIHPSWKYTLKARKRDFRNDIARDLRFEVNGIEDMGLEERKRSLEVPVKIKALYGFARNGKVLHRVSPHHEHTGEWVVDQPGRWRNPPPTDADTRRFGLKVYWLCNADTYNPFLTSLRPPDMPYCRSGCFSARCPQCQKVTHLDPKSGPEAKIPKCRHCKRKFA